MKIQDIQYGIVVRNEEGRCLHFVGFEEKPTIRDIEHIREELATDKEFGLTEIIDDLSIEEAREETVNFFKTYFLSNE